MSRPKTELERLFHHQLAAKQTRRQALAALPIEEKVVILVRLQKLASALVGARGAPRTPWRLP